MILNTKHPIGIFDSGLGGTSTWKEISCLLPNENTIYLSDSLNAPYGQKTKQKILELSIKNTEFLIQRKCKIIVIACNTATTNAIKYLRENYTIPFVGIEPAIKSASVQTKTKIIGILATKGTLKSDFFEETSSSINKKIEIAEQIGEGLVELIEAGKVESDEMNTLLRKYLQPMVNKNIDCLVLGCTHYPYLIPAIQKITNNSIKIIDSSKAVARQVKKILEQKKLLNTTTGKSISKVFYINKDKRVLEDILKDSIYTSIQEIVF